MDIPAECVRLIFSLNVISAGGRAESTVNQKGTEPVNSPSEHIHAKSKMKGTVQRSGSPGLTLEAHV